MTADEETQIRAVIAKEDELKQDWTKQSQNAKHRRILLAEVDRLRSVLDGFRPTLKATLVLQN